MSKHSAQIKKILDYDDQLKGRKQPIEVQLEQARREQREIDAVIVRNFEFNAGHQYTQEDINEQQEECARRLNRMATNTLSFKCPRCGLTTAGYGPEAPLCLLCAVRQEERERAAAIVQRELNQWDYYDPDPANEILKRVKKEIEQTAKEITDGQ